MSIFPPDTDQATYAWIIDKDHLDGIDSPSNRIGVAGPNNAPQELLDDLAHGQGIRWRCLDDDGEVYYSGRIVFTGPASYAEFTTREPGEGFKPGSFCVVSAWDEEEGFGPLWDFAGPDAGAVTIEYRDKDRKVWAVL